MRRARFDGFSVTLPRSWADVTEDVGGNGSVPTLARPDGVGALQFSIALYRSGERPDVTAETLTELLKEFGQQKRLGRPTSQVIENAPILLAAGTFTDGDDLVRVWYVAAAGNVAFVTYVCERTNFRPIELAKAEQIVRSLQFDPTAS